MNDSTTSSTSEAGNDKSQKEFERIVRESGERIAPAAPENENVRELRAKVQESQETTLPSANVIEELRRPQRPAWVSYLVMIVFFTALLFIVRYNAQYQSSLATLKIPWPVAERKGATLLVNGATQPLELGGPVEITHPPGDVTVILKRPGFEDIQHKYELKTGEVETMDEPIWTPVRK